MIAILTFLCVHWFLSLFFHTFFLHRYASHQMYTTSKGWERFFYFCTWFFQGSSYLIPRAYGTMHRMHHEFSDTEHDPHSPHFFKDVWSMMVTTRKIYNGFATRTTVVDEKFTEDPLPEWDALDRFGDHNITRLVFALSYVAFYVVFAPHWAWFLLLPIHFLIGPVQGAVVNWCGHKYGYSNFDNGDKSKNTSPWGILLMGELFQNNHHKFKDSPNFAKKWYEFDPSFMVMKVMHAVGIIKLKPVPVRSH
ncbi:acyl-CoA desaturase [Chitinophaga sedimenti]|jgi:stearoyl-CoA desaturase (Delta-9 desaturase)|uniref:acyl-CoA desaturase n=1 Tax=Chitinophaga sedimenti TaxID=2033606 RepID=UPI0020031500|nr:acyl-CoA desaturase [Chitinophaga sedimenti]MCK7555101.1 acyl-CoA desaturase [Chitinophaga sedimenti]